MSQKNTSLKETIEKRYQEFMELMKKGDVDGLANKLYMKDAKFFPPNGGEATGRDAIKEVISGILSSGVIIQLKPEEVEQLGDSVYEYGVGKVINTKGKELGIQRYMVIWKKDNGEWKIYRDMVKELEQ